MGEKGSTAVFHNAAVPNTKYFPFLKDINDAKIRKTPEFPGPSLIVVN